MTEKENILQTNQKLLTLLVLLFFIFKFNFMCWQFNVCVSYNDNLFVYFWNFFFLYLFLMRENADLEVYLDEFTMVPKQQKKQNESLNDKAIWKRMKHKDHKSNYRLIKKSNERIIAFLMKLSTNRFKTIDK